MNVTRYNEVCQAINCAVYVYFVQIYMMNSTLFHFFSGYNLYNEPNNLAQQTGSFEILSNGSNKFVRQMVQEWPIQWCGAESLDRAVSIIGEYTW